MKSFACIVLCIYSMLTYAQNVKDSYGDHTGDEEWPNVGVYGPYTGEYQIFLDQFFWTHANELDDGCISFSIEIVSFPFIPEEFEPIGLNNLTNYTQRDFNMRVLIDGTYAQIFPSLSIVNRSGILHLFLLIYADHFMLPFLLPFI